MALAYLISYLAWVFFINDLYAEKFGINWILYIVSALEFFMEFNFIKCYASDPGIIPKNFDDSAKIQNANIAVSKDKIKPKDVENTYNFLANSNNQSKDLNLDIENNISKYKLQEVFLTI